MYFSGLKYAAIVLCGVVSSETAFVPSVFEDFAGSSAIQLVQVEESSSFAPGWTLELLIAPGDLPVAPLTVRRIGLRAQQAGPTRIESIRASVTISTTRATALRSSPIDNTGANPTTFFIDGWWGVLPGAVSAPVLFFDLGAGYRFEPEKAGSLHLQIDLDTRATLSLETAPAKQPVFLTRFGDSESILHRETPIVSLLLDRRAPPPGAVQTIAKNDPIDRAKPRARPSQRNSDPSTTEFARLAADAKELRTRIRQLERRNAALESQLGLAIQTNARLASVVAEQRAPVAGVETAEAAPRASARKTATETTPHLALWTGGTEFPDEARRRRIAPYDVLSGDVTTPEVTRP